MPVPMPVTNGSVLHLFSKLEHGAPVAEQETLQLKVGHGIAGDVNACPTSPRQVLVVRAQDLQPFSIQPGTLRENIVVDGGRLEAFVPGSALRFGSGALLRLTFYCEPCKRIADLVRSLKDLEGQRGILGVVIAEGSLTVGDQFVIEPNAFPALPEQPYERFLQFLTKIPAGKVVTYKEVIAAIGVTAGYYRALPKYLQKAERAGYPVHRVLNLEGKVNRYVKGQAKRLEIENVLVDRRTDTVSLESYLWRDPSIYLV